MHPLVGHEQARRRILESFRASRLPQVILITGPVGVGKQRLGLWVGQLVLCQGPGPEGPCGECKACRRVLELTHPDLHWFIPISRPKAGEADRQVEEVAELIGEAVAARREEPLYAPADGMASHPIASARLLTRRAALTPAEGSRKVFVLGEAERLVPQESTPDAANALLKFLEEPPADTWIILTTPEAERVLPTIRSRAVPLRLARLSDQVVEEFASRFLNPKPTAAELEVMVRQSEGAIGRLRESGEGAGKAVHDARALLDLVRAGGRFERSLRQAPWSARGAFTDLLDALGAELAARARRADSLGAGRNLVTALERVQAARAEAQGNVNPQLLLASLAGELAEVL